MTPAEFELAQEIFDQACDAPEGERAALIERLAAGNEEVRQLVEGLLAEDARGDLPSPPARPVLLPPMTPSGQPATIGRYRIVRESGRGGMGMVYEAEQESPHRRVALKVIRTGSSSPELLRRFHTEAEILGRLQHPGIAQIFELGSVDVGEGGQPFFAMEFVEGAPLVEYAQANQLDMPARLSLMAKICDAVHYAHQRGVVHRDLKPDNILIKSLEGDAQPKILDFGIARVTDSDVQLTTMQTKAGEIIGTLDYMSPEQAAGNAAELDTRSDIYSLGVLLYELLAGQLPFELATKSIPQAVSMIQEEPPRRLSSLDLRFRGDIETIVRKCLEKEPERRYSSAAALADDLRRFLGHEPISARPPTTWYQIRKFTQRNRAIVGGTVATVLASLIGLVVAINLAIEARENSERAEANAARALRETYRAKISAASMTVLSQPEVAEGHLDSVPEDQRGWEWHYLRNQLANHVAVFRADAPVASEVAVTSDGTRVLATLMDGSVAVWDFATRELIDTVAFDDPIIALAVTGAAPYRVALGTTRWEEAVRTTPGHLVPDQGSVRVWEMDRDAWQPAMPFAVLPRGLLWDPSGERLALQTRRWLYLEVPGQLRAAEPVLSYVGPCELQLGSVFSDPRGSGFAFTDQTALYPYDFRYFDIPHSKSTKILQPRAVSRFPDDRYLCGEWSPDGELVAAGSQERTVYLLDGDTLADRGRLTGHSLRVTDIAWSPDGESLATSSDDSTVRLWDVQKRTCRTVIGTGGESPPIAFVPDGTGLIYRSGDHLRLWDMQERPITFTGHAYFIYYLAFASDGKTLASATLEADGISEVILWDPIEGGEVFATEYPVNELAFIDGDAALASENATFDTGSGRWTPTDAVESSRPGLRWSSNKVSSPDGSLHTNGVYREPGPIQLTGAKEAEFDGAYWGSAFSPDGKLLALCGQSGVLEIWDLETLTKLRDLKGHTSHVYCVEFHPDGTRLVSGGNDSRILFWDTESWEAVHELRDHISYVKALRFSPDGSQLASASADFTVKVWDTASRVQRRREAQDARELRDALRLRVQALFSKASDVAKASELLESEESFSEVERGAARRVLLELAHRPAPDAQATGSGE